MFKAPSSQKVKASVSTLDVVRQLGAKPVKKGERYWICCPFHKEKTPSMAIYPGSRGYYCFGCGRSGDAVDFYAGIKKMSMADALRELSDTFHTDKEIDCPVVFFDSDEHNRKKADERQELDSLVRQWRLIGSFVDMFRPGDELPDGFWDLVSVKADLEQRIDELCVI